MRACLPAGAADQWSVSIVADTQRPLPAAEIPQEVVNKLSAFDSSLTLSQFGQ